MDQPTPQEAWTIVTRRRRPPHFLPSTSMPPTHTRALSHPSPTYAQALQTNLTPTQSNRIVGPPHTNLMRPQGTKPFPTEAPIDTVHRTDPDRGDTPRSPLLPDPALSLCIIQTPTEHGIAKGQLWEPHVLFPELSPPLSCTFPQAFIAASSNPQNTPCQTHVTYENPQQQPRRTARIKTKRTATNDSALVSLEAHDFFDIPLQYAEGREILSLIGAAHIPIPAHLTQPTQPSNKAQPSNNKAQKNTGPRNAAKPPLPPLPPLAQPNQALPPNPHDHPSGPSPSARREGKEPVSDDTPQSL